jgi:phenol 2-monooxygenase
MVCILLCIFFALYHSNDELDFPSTGRFRILVFGTLDLLNPNGISSQALLTICNDIIPNFPQDTVELVVLHPFLERVFEWDDIPSCVKDVAEMKFHGPVHEQLYGIYGVDQDKGAIVVVRPDGYVGIISSLTHPSQADTYLSQCLVRVL